MNTYIPRGYQSKLSVYETQKAIGLLKRLFEDRLAASLNLYRVSAPLFVQGGTGLNDDLNGWERPVSFDIPCAGAEAQVVQSLAKWKRWALKHYEFEQGKGIYADMDAIRRDEDLDNLHSVYVDQWDWEKAISAEERDLELLKNTVRDIAAAVRYTQDTLFSMFPALAHCEKLPEDVYFIDAQELLDRYPDLSPKERENAIAKEKKCVFIIGIGKTLSHGEPHDGRAPDYDDWELNGDLLYWNELLDKAVELSSMGIRVSPESLDRQLNISGKNERRSLSYHKMLLGGELPLSIGGGIGQSRLSMLLLQKAHIGEVQASVWDEETRSACERAGILLL